MPLRSEASVKTDYSRIAPRYDRTRTSWGHVVDQDLAAWRADLPDHQVSALDVGCGTGINIRAQIELQENPERVTWVGLDPSRDMLREAEGKSLKAKWMLGTGENLPFSNETFDFIVNNLSFHHFTDKERALDEVKRVLRPNGLFN